MLPNLTATKKVFIKTIKTTHIFTIKIKFPYQIQPVLKQILVQNTLASTKNLQTRKKLNFSKVPMLAIARRLNFDKQKLKFTKFKLQTSKFLVKFSLKYSYKHKQILKLTRSFQHSAFSNGSKIIKFGQENLKFDKFKSQISRCCQI